MANVQRYFEKFHAAIRMDDSLNAELAEKRDIILRRVRDSLKAKGRPGFETLLQGSYRMKTGVRPLDAEHDIDVGLRFDFDSGAHSAATVRQWVVEAVEGHTDSIEPRGPCIRVVYAKGFHVDLVVYACWTPTFGAPECRLAHRDRGWIEADPVALLEYVRSASARFEGTESGTGIDQLRRVVRYLKRWNDAGLGSRAGVPASGLAFTLLAIDHLVPATDPWSTAADDRQALAQLARHAASQTTLAAFKPTPEYEDMFGKLTRAEMARLVARFGELASALESAERAVDPVVACTTLSGLLGDDFPIPAAASTGTPTRAPAIVASSSSA